MEIDKELGEFDDEYIIHFNVTLQREDPWSNLE